MAFKVEYQRSGMEAPEWNAWQTVCQARAFARWLNRSFPCHWITLTCRETGLALDWREG